MTTEFLNTLFLHILVPILVSMIASSGFWMFLEKKTQKQTYQSELLIGLAHDRITFLGMSYIQRGWIYHDEYENLLNYLYKPYKDLGGNGSVDRVMTEVNKLPIKENTYTVQTRRTKRNVKQQDV